MNKPTIIILILILLTALITWQYFMPAFDKVSGLREELKIWQKKLEETQILSQKLEDLKKKYNTMSDEIERMNQALPKGEDVPGLLVQLEQLASQNGLILNNISFAVAQVKKAKTTTIVSEDSALLAPATDFSGSTAQGSLSSSETKILTIDLSLTGAQNSFKTFLLAIEANLRIMDVATISFANKGSSGKSDNELAEQDFKISLNTYFQ